MIDTESAAVVAATEGSTIIIKHVQYVWEECRETRCVSMMRGSFSSSVSLRQERQRERRMTRGGSILLPSTSVLDSDEWRPAFSELSRSEVPFSFLTYFWTTSDVVPLINGELESFSLRERVGRNKEPTHRRFYDDMRHQYQM